MTAGSTAGLAVHLAGVLAVHLAIHLAITTRVLARVLTIRLAITARVLAVATGVIATPGTTELLVIRIVKGDCGVNTAGPGCVGIATGERRLFRWGLN